MTMKHHATLLKRELGLIEERERRRKYKKSQKDQMLALFASEHSKLNPYLLGKATYTPPPTIEQLVEMRLGQDGQNKDQNGQNLDQKGQNGQNLGQNGPEWSQSGSHSPTSSSHSISQSTDDESQSMDDFDSDLGQSSPLLSKFGQNGQNLGQNGQNQPNLGQNGQILNRNQQILHELDDVTNLARSKYTTIIKLAQVNHPRRLLGLRLTGTTQFHAFQQGLTKFLIIQKSGPNCYRLNSPRMIMVWRVGWMGLRVGRGRLTAC